MKKPLETSKISHKAISFFRHLKRDPSGAFRRLRGYFQDPLFLYQMGKVGSSTHRNTLQERYHVYHLHTLKDFLSKYESIHERMSNLEQRELDLITIAREPVGRKISTFFQNLVDTHYSFSFESESEAAAAGVDELLKRFHAWEEGIEEATSWYDRHFEPATGVCLYDYDFDKDRGWAIHKSGRWRMLVLRFTDIKINHVEALNYFVTTRFGDRARIDALRASNISSKKWYSERMEEFRKRLYFSTSELDLAYDSRYMRYFHTDQEIARMRSLWQVR